jgi:uncharacterized membrane protein YeaQ/YmgE (transglycosylase-associated protein family)
MKRFGFITAVSSAIIIGLVTLLQYGWIVLIGSRFITGQLQSVDVTRVPGGAWFIPIIALLIGVIAGWLAYQQRTDQRTNCGARAGIWAGVGALIGTTVVGAALLAIAGADPVIQEFVRNSEPHPEARIPYEFIAPLAAGVGALLGSIAGLYSLGAAIVGGLLVDLVAG